MERAKFVFFLVLFTLFSNQGIRAQGIRMRPTDRLMVGVFTDYWRNVPGSVDPAAINRGIDLFLLQDMPLGTSRFSVAGGLAFFSHNLYTDHRYEKINGTFDFVPIRQEYKNNKLNLNYLGIPVELRFRGRDGDRGLRLYLGFSAAVLIQAHTKYRGLDPAGTGEIKVKENQPDQIRPFMMHAHFRIGIGKWSAYARVPLSEVFQGNSATGMTPVSLGLGLSIY